MISSNLITQAIISRIDESNSNFDSSRLSEELVAFLKKNHLINLLPNIIKNLEDHICREKKSDTVEITTSHQFDEEAIRSVRKYIAGWNFKNVVISVDPSIVGGVVIEGDNKIIDASVKGNIQDLKELLKR